VHGFSSGVSPLIFVVPREEILYLQGGLLYRPRWRGRGEGKKRKRGKPRSPVTVRRLEQQKADSLGGYDPGPSTKAVQKKKKNRKSGDRWGVSRPETGRKRRMGPARSRVARMADVPSGHRCTHRGFHGEKIAKLDPTVREGSGGGEGQLTREKSPGAPPLNAKAVLVIFSGGG